jgi:hypothetical protein
VTHLALNGSDVAVALPAMRLHPGLACTMSFAVANGSDADVRIERVVLPFMGPDAGAGVHATRIRQHGVRPSRQGGPDALFDSEHDPSGDYLAGGHQAARLTADLSWSSGCMEAGAGEWHRQAPIVTVSVEGVPRDLHGEGVGSAVVGTTTSCDR